MKEEAMTFDTDTGLKKAQKELEAELKGLESPTPEAPAEPETPAEPEAPEATPEPDVPAEDVEPDTPAEPAEPEEPETPDPEQQAKDDHIADLEKEKKRVAELTKKLNDRDGEHGTQLAQLRQQNMLLQAELERAKSTPAAPAPEEDKPDLRAQAERYVDQMSEEARDKWDREDLITYAMTNMELSRVSSPKGEDAAPKSVEEIKQRLDKMENRRWYETIETQAPGFLTANGDEDTAPGDPEWVAYLEQPVYPGSPITRSQALSQASAEAVAQEFQNYAAAKNGDPAPQPRNPRPTVAQQISPRTSSSGTRTPKAKPNYTSAQADAIQRKAANPGASEADNKAWKDVVSAYQEGRVIG